MSKEGKATTMGARGADGAVAMAARLLALHGREVRALLGPRGGVAEWGGPPEGAEAALRFYRQHVAASAPALIHAATDAWPLPAPWTADDLVRAAGEEAIVRVAVTPDGRADAVRRVAAATGAPAAWGGVHGHFVHETPSTTALRFVQPAEEDMALPALLGALREEAAIQEPDRPPAVHYAQAQNGSLSSFGALSPAAVPPALPWANALFGTGPPDAANVWVGGAASVTAWHRDPYENVYVVLSGEKRFALRPPGEGAGVLRPAHVPAARWVRVQGAGAASWAARPDSPPATVPWSPAPPPREWAVPGVDPPPRPGGGVGADPPPLMVTVPAGSALYLPAFWWHCVSQAPAPRQPAVIAVNYWYDTLHGPGWAGMLVADRLAGVVAGREENEEEEEDG